MNHIIFFYLKPQGNNDNLTEWNICLCGSVDLPILYNCEIVCTPQRKNNKGLDTWDIITPLIYMHN